MTEPAPSWIVGQERRLEIGDAAELQLHSLSSPNTSNVPDP
jgi:hypothetical protein